MSETNKIEFRTLRPDEIEVRVAQVKTNGVQLLLYKDARCDMSLLDETVGPDNWQRKHDEHNGNLFCSVGIRINGDWVWKEDAGAESNTEAEKGHASDSFKRACVNWGIGRELYTAPFIWYKDAEIENGKCRSTFSVTAIAYDEQRRICALTVSDDKKKTVAYQMGKATPNLICAKCKGIITDVRLGDKFSTAETIHKRTGGLCWTCYQDKVRAEADARGKQPQ